MLMYLDCLIQSISHPRSHMQHIGYLLTQGIIQMAIATEAYQVAPVFSLVGAPPYAVAVPGQSNAAADFFKPGELCRPSTQDSDPVQSHTVGNAG